jgi:hypothetical protein
MVAMLRNQKNLGDFSPLAIRKASLGKGRLKKRAGHCDFRERLPSRYSHSVAIVA